MVGIGGGMGNCQGKEEENSTGEKAASQEGTKPSKGAVLQAKEGKFREKLMSGTVNTSKSGED